jgi:hypothetical protein
VRQQIQAVKADIGMDPYAINRGHDSVVLRRSDRSERLHPSPLQPQPGDVLPSVSSWAYSSEDILALDYESRTEYCGGASFIDCRASTEKQIQISLGTSLAEHSGASMQTEEELLLAFHKFREALFQSDVISLRDIITEEYRGFDPRGQPQDKKMTLEAYSPGGVKLQRYDVEDIEIRIIGEVGIICGKGIIQGLFGEHEFRHNLRFLDLYVRRDSRWQLYLSQVTPLVN